jgi:HAE1 family hydrophobic/amphiphilic exporter-1
MFKNFIKRPVMAIVVSLIIIFMGLLSIKTLPISQFPEIAPPRVIVTLAYPGASADTVLRSPKPWSIISAMAV